MVKYAKPVGVVAAVCPSTNPAATPVNKAMMALKGGNAVIVAPSPAGLETTTRTVAAMRAELARLDKTLAKTRKQRDGVARKLGNERFVAKAPEAIVAAITGTKLTVRAEGEDEAAAVRALSRLISSKFDEEVLAEERARVAGEVS